MDIQQLRRQVHLPGFFDQPPAGVGFMRKIRELRGFREAIKVIGQADVRGRGRCAMLKFSALDRSAQERCLHGGP